MLQERKITSEEALRLLDALGEDAEAEDEAVETETGHGSGMESEMPLEEVMAWARRLRLIVLWSGLGITVLGGLLMFWALRSAGMGFWFYCAWVPFLLGVVLIALGGAGRSVPWVLVRLEQEEHPRTLAFGLPLPLWAVAWGLRTFGRSIPGLDRIAADEIVQVLAASRPDAPLIVHVDEGENGERVQVFIG
ncbi:MAG: hypothetical protein D6770_10975 [Anaerolineae bacterium]|nr:MAG: hypothetical protein D6770_10975 [Anaerolineae bacterium]